MSHGVNTETRTGNLARAAGTSIGLIALALAAGASILVIHALAQGWLNVNDANGLETLVAVIMLAYGFSGAGLVVVRRLPTNPLGWIYLAIGFFEALNLFAGGYSTLAYYSGGGLPLAAPLSWIGVWAWVPAFTLFSTAAILLFPTGRLPSRRWWPVLVAAAIAFALLVVPVAVATWPYRGPLLEAASALNLQPPPDSSIAAAFAIQNVAQFLLLAAMAGSVAGLIARFRGAPPAERQQLKWFASAAIVDLAIIVGWVLVIPVPIVAVVSSVVFGLALPAAIAIAILRYRLYDIDRLISRTISWGMITASIGAIYLAAVLLLQGEIGGVIHGDVLTVSLSTLVAAAAFQPLRRRIQRAVDRRFDRRHANAEASSAGLGVRLRGEVDLDAIADDLVGVVDEAVRPRGAALWLRNVRDRSAVTGP